MDDIFQTGVNTNVEVNTNIETITDNEVQNTPSDSIVSIDQLLNNNESPAKETASKEIVLEKGKPKKDKILIIQIILLVTWAILTVLVYFFGYDLFEPFIKV